MHERTRLTSIALIAASGICALGTSQVLAQIPTVKGVESMLMWTPEQQLERYPAIERFYETRAVKRGARISPLLKAPRELSVRIEWQGKSWTLEEWMQARRISGLLVLEDGRIALERYALNRTANDRWTSFSVAKSITSTLVGAAIRDGHIKSIDERITTYLPELAGSSYEGVTLRQLLSMTSGVQWNEDYTDPKSDVAVAHRARVEPELHPLIEYMRKLPRAAPHGMKFSYSTGETDLVGLLVARATRTSLAEYLSEKIWQPYGMEQDAAWLVDRGRMERGGCCLSMTLRDYARFGQFILDGGHANGRAVLPEGWIAAATTNQLPEATQADALRLSSDSTYGYLWWTHADGSGYEANGAFGQGIKVFPKDRIVIAINSAAATANSPEQRAAFLALMSSIRTAAK